MEYGVARDHHRVANGEYHNDYEVVIITWMILGTKQPMILIDT